MLLVLEVAGSIPIPDESSQKFLDRISDRWLKIGRSCKCYERAKVLGVMFLNKLLNYLKKKKKKRYFGVDLRELNKLF